MKPINKIMLTIVSIAIILIGINWFYQIVFGSWTKSEVTDKDGIHWKISTIKLGEKDRPDKIQFLDSKQGFITAFDKVYRTTDGGKSWEKTGSFEKFGLMDSYFINSVEGFAISYIPFQTYGVFIEKTINGGATWETIHTLEPGSGYLSKIAFNADGIGVAVGRRHLSEPRIDAGYFVLLTADEGKSWTDVSEYLNKIAERNRNDQIMDSLTNVIFTRDKGISVLSSNGKIYKTLDQGKSWEQAFNLTDRAAQTGIHRLGQFDNGTYWVSGGANSEEGTWGSLAIKNNRFNWEKYELRSYDFSDALFLSDNEVIVCGGKQLNTGVILYSEDRGKNWSIVYESKESSRFTSIVKLSEGKLIVGGENGVIVSLEK